MNLCCCKPPGVGRFVAAAVGSSYTAVWVGHLGVSSFLLSSGCEFSAVRVLVQTEELQKAWLLLHQVLPVLFCG